MIKIGLLIGLVFTEIYMVNTVGGAIFSSFLTSCLFHFASFSKLVIELNDLNISSFAIFFWKSVFVLIAWSVKLFYYDSIAILDSHTIIFAFILLMSMGISGIKRKAVKFLKDSHFFSHLFTDYLFPILNTYFFYYNRIGNKDLILGIYADGVVNVKGLLIEVLLCICIFEPPTVFSTIYKGLYSKSNTQSSDKKQPKVSIFSGVVRNLIKSAFYYLIVNLAFIINSNKYLLDSTYSIFMSSVSQPNNLIIYNSLPADSDSRFRILMFVALYIRRKLF